MLDLACKFDPQIKEDRSHHKTEILPRYMTMIERLVHQILFPVPPKSPFPNNGHEYHEVRTPNGYCIPLLHYPYQSRKRDSKSKSKSKVLVVSHGNGTDLTKMADILKYFRDIFNISVIGYEYIGYNHTRRICSTAAKGSSCCLSTGCENDEDDERTIVIPDHQITPSEAKCYESITAAHDYITNALGYPGKRQVWMGISIGGGPTLDLVSRLGTPGIPAGVILISPFYSVASVVSDALSYLWDAFPNYAKIAEVQVPILILHGSDDEVISVDHSERLQHCSQGNHVTRYVIEGAMHNDILTYQETLKHIKDFLKSCSS